MILGIGSHQQCQQEEAVGSQEPVTCGMACRVPHSARLGCLRNIAYTITPLTEVRSGGGIVARTVLVILRRHPVIMQLRFGLTAGLDLIPQTLPAAVTLLCGNLRSC